MKLDAKVISLYGATASGKSSLALRIAQELGNVIIINADSRQVYKEVPIITAQPKLDDKNKLYGIISLKDDFSVAHWLQFVKKEIIAASDKKIILVGGTGLYLDSLMNGLSEVPEIADDLYIKLQKRLESEGWDSLYKELLSQDPTRKILPQDKQRLIRALAVLEGTGKSLTFWQQKSREPLLEESQLVKIWLKPSRDLLYKNINERFLQMLELGALEEAAKLQNWAELPKIIGLQEILGYLKGDFTKEDMIKTAQQKTRNYAKRQETWFKNRFNPDLILHDYLLKELPEVLF